MRTLVVILFIVLTTALAYARPLTQQEIDRLRGTQEQLRDVDQRPLNQTIRELEKAKHPDVSIAMKEAMAHTYTDMIQNFMIVDRKKKEWIYSMVCLNMAYLQFGGDAGKPGSTTELNRLIRQKLIKYLPADILKQPGFLTSL